MKLTTEQQAIIKSTGDIKINAVAGSGKTTTIIEYARTRPAGSRILYVAFNRSVKMEAAKRFADLGLHNVQVETAHSLAFKQVVAHSGYRVRAQGYRTHEIADLLGLESTGEKHAEYIVANHISKFIAYFCNSSCRKVSDLNYLDVVTDAKAKIFVSSFYVYIEKQVRILLAKMDRQEIEIIHDFYLKKFQLQNPQLNYDYILFDEGQDASPAMLDIFLNQNATRVIVGDTHQQIYGWRFAVNSLEKVSFKTYHLTSSFRFRQEIADLACAVLGWKSHLQDYKPIPITGMGTNNAEKSKAVIGRTNLGLLLKAIQYTTEKKDLKYLYFEGNISSYTYADEGASLYDVLNLYNGSRNMIRDKLIQAMGSLEELEDYIEKTEDVQMGMMVEIVKEYGDEIPRIIKTLRDKHVSNEEKDKAEMIFTTVHRCKGMEYDAVQLVNDFITEEKLEKQLKEGEQAPDKARLNEEINLLYVAITRTRNVLHIPEAFVADDFPSSPRIHLVKPPAPTYEKVPTYYEYEHNNRRTNKKQVVTKSRYQPAPPKTSKGAKSDMKGGYKPWSDKEDKELSTLFYSGETIFSLANHFERTAGAIRSRIKKLELK